MLRTGLRGASGHFAEAEPAALRRRPVRVAILVRRFPKLSETFILNQITGLLDGGVDVDVFAWTPGDADAVHSEVRRFGLATSNGRSGLAK